MLAESKSTEVGSINEYANIIILAKNTNKFMFDFLLLFRMTFTLY